MPDAPSSRRVKRRRGARVIVLAREVGTRGVSTRAGDSVAGPGSTSGLPGSTSVLLQGDTDPGIPGSRFWQTPGGGIDPGESAREAAARELYEETGLAIDPTELGEPIATRTVAHGYSDRILIQHETYFRLHVERFEPVHAALSPAEVRRRVATAWHPLDDLPEHVWPAELAAIARHDGAPLDLGEVEESTVPVEAAQRSLSE